MTMNATKQARLDCFEIRHLWPGLAERNIWPFDAITCARRASMCLHNADVLEASYNGREKLTERAERRAQRAADRLNEIFAKAGITYIKCRIDETGYGFRFLTITDRKSETDGIGSTYALI